MVDLSLFREPEFSLNLFTATLAFIAIAGIVLLLPFYLELVLGLPLSQVGLLMAVVPVIMILLQPVSGTLSDRLGTRPVSMVGLLFIFAGYVAMTTLRADGTPMGYVLRMLPVTIGMATFNSPNNSAIMGAVPRASAGRGVRHPEHGADVGAGHRHCRAGRVLHHAVWRYYSGTTGRPQRGRPERDRQRAARSVHGGGGVDSAGNRGGRPDVALGDPHRTNEKGCPPATAAEQPVVDSV